MPENRIFPALALLFALLLPVTASAQVPVEISKQKIVSDGKIYFMHKVLKGQTLYSISKAYNISVDAVARENVIPPKGIQEGQILKIPSSSSSVPAQTRSEVKTQPQSQSEVIPARQDEKYIYHRVIRGETLYSLSRQYGISIRALKKANKGLLYPREGEYLMIPRDKADETIETKPVAEKTIIAIEPSIVVDTLHAYTLTDTMFFADEKDTLGYMREITVISRLQGSVRVAVMLPFFLEENSVKSYIDSTKKDSKGKKIYKEVRMPGGYIYEGSLPFIEMYEGILIAVDSLRSLGLDIELDVYDTEADTTKIDWMISSGRLRDFDLIIGPVFSYNLGRIAEFAARNDIPVVSPVQLRDQNILYGRPTLFRMCPSHLVSQDIMINEIASHPNSNVIFLYSDSLMIDPQTYLFWEKLTTRIKVDGITDSTLITPCYFTGLGTRYDANKGVGSMESLMKSDRENIVILTTTLTPRVSSALSTLHSLARNYNIKVIGYPELASLETIDLRYYYDLNMLVPSESYIDYTKPSTSAFLRTYNDKFKTEPTAESFAWRGFDMAYYFIGGLAVEGRSFIRRPFEFHPALLSHDIEFSRDDRRDGFENRGMYILHYNNDMTVTVTRPESRMNMETESGESQSTEILDRGSLQPDSLEVVQL